MAAPRERSGARVPSGIVPRWEWRGFGEEFDVADEVLDPLSPERTGSSDERYLLSSHSDASVKVRDDKMDVKRQIEVDEYGLELWAPTLKADFPLTQDEVRETSAALGVGIADQREASTLDDLVGRVLDGRDGLVVVDVHKRRTHYDVDGCMVEATEISVDGTMTRTVTVESPDRSVVVDTLARLGLAGRRNVSLARGLKTLVGFGTTRFAVIDIGTNSVKFHLAERRADGAMRTVEDRAETTRLGEGQGDDGVLAAEPIARTVDAVRTMAAHARRHDVAEIVAVGTAGLRRAPNRSILVDAVRSEAHVDVEVISGVDEARLAYLAATSALPVARGALAVFDSGGGSTQFTFGADTRVDDQFSVDVGAVRIAERFDLAGQVSTAALDEVLDALAAELSRLGERPRPDSVVAIGGTATNLAAVHHGLTEYDPDVVHGTILDVAELDRQIELYRSRDADERRAIAGLQPARAEVILGGACIVRTVLTSLGHETMTVSDRGLRHGVLIDRFGADR